MEKKTTEDLEQEAVVEYCDWLKIPIVHIPNESKRSVAYGAKLKRMGLRPGFPDLFIPIAKKGYHGLFIEMKAKGGRTTKEQEEWILKLRSYGYAAALCIGSNGARKVIEKYFKEE